MSWWFKLKCRLRRLLGLHVPIVGHIDYVEDGELKRRPIYIDQFYK